jgi:hypothetical protein
VITRKQIIEHLDGVAGEWRTLDQITASLGSKISRLDAARFFNGRGARTSGRPRDTTLKATRLALDAAEQVRRGRRDILRDRLYDLYRDQLIEVRKEQGKITGYRRSKTKRCLLWAVVNGGYRVAVYENGREIYDYSAGNSRHESQTYLPVGHHNAIPLRELRKLAKITVAELAAEHKVPKSCIEEDEDMRDALRIELLE